MRAAHRAAVTAGWVAAVRNLLNGLQSLGIRRSERKVPRPVGDAYVAHPTSGDGSVVAMQQLAEEFSLQAVMPLIGRTSK